MALREIVLLGDPVLRKEAEDVTEFGPELEELVRDMYETMYHAEGIGLAAPQIGISKRILVIDLRSEEEPDARLAVVNPTIVWESDETDKAPEGCLSIPGFEEVVRRPSEVTIEGFTPQGEEMTIEAGDLFARALQHEIDHLDGVLFIDRITPLKRRMLLKKWKKLEAERE